MATREFVWAIDENGKPCKCFAKPENRGKKNCKHQDHAEPGQSPKEFFKQHGVNHSIFQEKKIEVLPYRLTEEEKEGLTKITCKKDLLDQNDNGAYIELKEALWSDMDKNYFAENYGMKKKDIEAILHGEAYMVFDDYEDPETGKKYKSCEIIYDLEEGERLWKEGEADTSVKMMNWYAEEKCGWQATKDIYVLPYYMRAGIPDGKGGEINSDETDAYQRLLTTGAYGWKHQYVNQQKAYESLLTGGERSRTSVYARKSLSERLGGKKGVFRCEAEGTTLPFCGRACATPNAQLPYDECEIPPRIAVDIFRPTITKVLKDRGFTPEQIKEVISDAKGRQENVTPITKNLIQSCMDEGNVRVLLNRQPSLHSASLQGFKPRLSNDHTIHTNPIVAQGYNLDFDGDTLSCVGVNNEEIAMKVDAELHPSKFKYEPRNTQSLMMQPRKDSLFGLMSVLKARTN